MVKMLSNRPTTRPPVVSGCATCPNRGRFAGTRGKPESDFLICGEAPGCFPKGTPVSTPQGFVEIESLAAGDVVLDGEGFPTSIRKTFSRENEDGLVTLKLVGGKSVSLTANHQVFVHPLTTPFYNTRRAIGQGTWIESGKLSPSYAVYIPWPKVEIKESVWLDLSKYWTSNQLKDTPNNIQLTPSLARAFGLYMAEGSANEKAGQVEWSLNGLKEEKLAEDLVNTIVNELHVDAKASITGENNSNLHVVVNSTKHARFFRDNFGTSSLGKNVPDFRWAASDDVVNQFLLGWYEGDGNHLKKNCKNRDIITISPVAAEQLFWLYSRLHVYPTWKIEPPSKRSRFGANYPTYRIGIRNSDVLKLGWNIDTHNKTPRLIHTETTDGVIVPIKSISVSPNKCTVYNIETGSHDYCVPLKVHNSNELIDGIPFTGESGSLLNQALTRAGFPDDGDIFITNALRCRPPLGPIANSTLQCCQPRLMEEIAAHPRKVILALGNSATRSILDRFDLKITQVRGQHFMTPYGLVIPTVHPAAVLRAPGDYKKMAVDIAYAVSLYQSDGTMLRSPGETKFTVIRTLEDVQRALRGLTRVKYFGADIETSGFNPREDRILCLGIAWEKNKVLIFPGRILEEYAELFRPLFASPDHVWIWHNGKFDTNFLHHLSLEARVDEDTMLAHYATNEQSGTHGLKQLASDILGATDYEEALKPYLAGTDGSYSNIPNKVLYPYLARDCDYTLQLHDIIQKELQANKGLPELYHRVLLPASKFLQTVEEKGIYVNRDALEVLRVRLTGELDSAFDRLQEIVHRFWNPEVYAITVGAKKIPTGFNPGSWQQVGYMLYDVFNLKPGKGLKKTTDNKVLLSLGNNPFVLALMEYRKAGKALSTYIEGVDRAIEKDGRVHSTYLIHGTETGRLSSRNPNMQNQPRNADIRSMFQAPADRFFVELDYASAELRALAHLSGDEYLIQVFVDGRDLHDEVSVALYGPNFTKEQRMRAKAVNFGIAYGRGAASLAQEFNIPLIEAEKMIADWFARFPKAHKYIEACRLAPLMGRTMITPLGRRRRFGLVTKGNENALQNQSSNFPIQSLASDLTLISGIRLKPSLDPLDAFAVNIVHDSLLIECAFKREVVMEVARLGDLFMRETPILILKTIVPFATDYKIGTRWGHLKTVNDPKNPEETTFDKIFSYFEGLKVAS
jgi:uracil-DNA glycosylase family 4